jgi:hypothetical protein
METFAVYLVKSCALIALFYIAYFFLLRKETFFKSNRWYLLFGLVTSVMLPLVTFRKVIWIEPVSQNAQWCDSPLVMAPLPVQSGFEIDWMVVIGVFYALGLTAFLLNFFLDFYSLRKALKGKTMFRQADYRFVDTDENIAPFSYFNYIVYNSSLYDEAELANIIEHEKVHSNQNHTMDVLFARAFCIVFWFNPFVWFYKKAMLQNLEFIADSEALKKIEDAHGDAEISAAKKSYQITLLKVTAHENCVDISNHFYQSLIKKRIVMLNKNQSKKSNSWKYFLIVPALAAFMVYFQVKVVAQERETTENVLQGGGTSCVIDKNTSDADLKREAERLKKEHGVTLKFSKVKRNREGEITSIKATFKDQSGKKGTTQVSGDEPIAPFRFYKKDNGAVGFGNGRGGHDVRVVGAGRNFMPEFSDDFVFTFGDDDLDIDVDPDVDIDVDVPDAPDAPDAPPAAPSAPNMRIFRNGKSLVVKEKDGKHTVIVDGKVIEDADVDKIMSEIGPIIINGEDVLKPGHAYSYAHSGDGKAMIIDADKISAEAMKNAQAAMERAAPKMEQARAKMEKKLAEMDAKRATISRNRDNRDDQLREEMDRTRAELEKTREEMKKEIEAMKKAREEMKAELEKGRAKSKK